VVPSTSYLCIIRGRGERCRIVWPCVWQRWGWIGGIGWKLEVWGGGCDVYPVGPVLASLYEDESSVLVSLVA